MDAKNSLKRASVFLDDVIGIVSPKAALKRKICRFGYEAVDKFRTRKKRKDLGGTADGQLTENALYGLREIHRDLCRNNPLIKGLLKTECNGAIGKGPSIQARTDDDGWNKAAEELWKEEMINQTCDVTGRFNFDKFLAMIYLGYRRDGDIFSLFVEDKLQGIEGDCIGTPIGMGNQNLFEVINGIAYDKKTKRVIGYYIGSPDKYGNIQNSSYDKYEDDTVSHIFNPDRFSQSRGEPALTASINFIDTLDGYIDASLVAAKINACFSVYIKQNNMPDMNMLPEYFDTTKSPQGPPKEKMEPGIITRLQPGEDVIGVGQTHPGPMFDPFVMRMLMLIGRPLCMPLALIALDFSGATFMNIRLAYQEARDNWRCEQENVIKPFVMRVWKWKINQWVQRKELTNRNDMFRHEILCHRWPYVDPYKEALADEQQLQNCTTTRNKICSQQGDEFQDIIEQLKKERELLDEAGLAPPEKTRIKIQGE